MALNAKTLIERYGQNISIKKSSDSDLILTKAFVQPLRCDWQSELYGDYVDENKVVVTLTSMQISSSPIEKPKFLKN